MCNLGLKLKSKRRKYFFFNLLYRYIVVFLGHSISLTSVKCLPNFECSMASASLLFQFIYAACFAYFLTFLTQKKFRYNPDPMGLTIGVLIVIMQLSETTTLPMETSSNLVAVIASYLNFQ